MSFNSAKFGFVSLFCMVSLAIGLMNHVLVLPPLLGAARRDAWLSVLLAVIPYALWLFLLYLVMKWTKQQPLMEWVQSQYGRAAGFVFRVLFFVYLMFICLVTLKETIIWSSSFYLPRTPEIVLSVAFLLVCCYGVISGIRAIAYASGILLPFVVIFGDFVMSANLPRKAYILMFPVFEEGLMPMFEGLVYLGGGLTEFLVVLLLQHHLKKEVPFWKLLLLGMFLILLVFGPVTGAITEFGPHEAARLRYPAYEEWRLVKIGRYVQHVDFLSIYQWIAGAFVRLAAALFLMLELAVPGGSGRRRMIWLVCISAAIAAIAGLPYSDIQFLYFLRAYLAVSCGLATLVLLALLALAAASGLRKGGSQA